MNIVIVPQCPCYVYFTLKKTKKQKQRGFEVIRLSLFWFRRKRKAPTAAKTDKDENALWDFAFGQSKQ